MSSRFRNVERLGNRIDVPIPKDEQGYLGRECPNQECLGYFKIRPGTGLKGEDLPCYCPYCGHKDGHDRFWTPEQIEYAKSIALRQLSEAVRKDLKGLEFDHKPKGPFGIGISMKLMPGRPIPIRNYRERQLETHVTCASCTLEYGVYGLFAYCPDCATHNSAEILQRNLALVRKQVTLAGAQEDADFRRHLLEDALENCVSAFDGFGRELARVRASRTGVSLPSLSFQNLEKANARLVSLFQTDLKAVVDDSTWQVAQRGFMRRHVIAHRAGVVDQQYVDETGDTTTPVGRRLNVTAEGVDQVAAAVEVLGASLTSVLRT